MRTNTKNVTKTFEHVFNMKVDNIVYLNIKIKINWTIKLGPIPFY